MFTPGELYYIGGKHSLSESYYLLERSQCELTTYPHPHKGMNFAEVRSLVGSLWYVHVNDLHKEKPSGPVVGDWIIIGNKFAHMGYPSIVGKTAEIRWFSDYGEKHSVRVRLSTGEDHTVRKEDLILLGTNEDALFLLKRI